MAVAAGQPISATNLNVSHPLLVFDGSFDVALSASTSFQVYIDQTDIMNAPADGKLIVDLRGMAGSNANAVVASTRVRADNGVSAGPATRSHAPAAQFDSAACADSHTYSSGQSIGFDVELSSSIATGNTRLICQLTAFFVPDLSLP